MRKPTSVDALADLGRVRLSKSFFMRDMLHSEIVFHSNDHFAATPPRTFQRRLAPPEP